ncbi:MAG: hypothetical protein V4714_08010 [Bacteroidota bacterium]
MEQINQHLTNFSFALAQTMESAEVRALLKAEALKRFDGDYDILYKNIATVVLSDGSTLKTRLERLNPSSSAEDNFGKLPTLQISIPVNAEFNIGNLDDQIGYKTIIQEQCQSVGYYDLGSNFKFKSFGRH